MTERRALFIQGDGSDPEHTAEETRLLMAATFGGQTYDAVSPAIGAIARGHGVIGGGLAVTANGTPNNTVHVAAGIAGVRGTQENDQGVYVVGNDAQDTLTINASTTNPRNDLIVAQVRDGQYSAHTGDDWTLAVIEGTPAGSPVDPAVPEDALVLARVRVPTGVSPVISAAEIDDLRPRAVATGGITPVGALADYPSPRAHDYAVENATGRLWRHNGSVWVPAGPLGTLGIARRLTDQLSLGPSMTNFAGMSVTVSVPAANRRIRITAHAYVQGSANANFSAVIREGSSTLGKFGWYRTHTANEATVCEGSVILDNPTPGSHTYLASMEGSGGSSFGHLASTDPGWIMAEDIGPTS